MGIFLEFPDFRSRKTGFANKDRKKTHLTGTPPSFRAARCFCSATEFFRSGAESSWYDSFGTEQVWCNSSTVATSIGFSKGDKMGINSSTPNLIT